MSSRPLHTRFSITLSVEKQSLRDSVDEYCQQPEAFTAPELTGPLECDFSVPPTKLPFLFPSAGTWVSFLTALAN